MVEEMICPNCNNNNNRERVTKWRNVYRCKNCKHMWVEIGEIK